MHTNTQSQADIVTHQTNIVNKISTMAKGFLSTIGLDFFIFTTEFFLIKFASKIQR